jgi:hypothetical protein
MSHISWSHLRYYWQLILPKSAFRSPYMMRDDVMKMLKRRVSPTCKLFCKIVQWPDYQIQIMTVTIPIGCCNVNCGFKETLSHVSCISKGPRHQFRRSYISDAILILSSLVCQYQPVLSGLLQHSVLRMLRVSSCPKNWQVVMLVKYSRKRL